MWMLFNIFCFIFFFSSHLFSSEVNSQGQYRIDGVFSIYDGEKKFYLLTLFLPYNPTIISYTDNPEVKNICSRWWEKGNYFSEKDYSNAICDLLWVDSGSDELAILHNASDKVKQARAIFTKTHFASSNSPAGDYWSLKTFLEESGFTLLGHWYREGQDGEAIFVRKDLFAAAMRTLNYTPSDLLFESTAAENNLEQFFKKPKNKSHFNKIDGIDFIYMINLDERPEKFAKASHDLAIFGIFPYRFSAINGWKLSGDVLNQLGVKFCSQFNGEQFLGAVYKEVDGEVYLGNEIIEPNGETFFTIGMTRGSIGIILSHLSVLQDAYDSGYQTIWVMEDDVEAVDNPRLVSGLIDKLDDLVDDWDILFTDQDTKDNNGNYVPCRALAARLNVRIEPFSSFMQRFYKISEDFSRVGMRYGAYSMIIRRSGMEKILKYYKTYGIFIPYDMDIWLNPDLKMYCVTKDIVSHRAGSPTDNSAPNYAETH